VLGEASFVSRSGLRQLADATVLAPLEPLTVIRDSYNLFPDYRARSRCDLPWMCSTDWAKMAYVSYERNSVIADMIVSRSFVLEK